MRCAIEKWFEIDVEKESELESKGFEPQREFPLSFESPLGSPSFPSFRVPQITQQKQKRHASPR